MKLILLDIEGTTTSIDFVAKVLFPYSYQRLEDFVKKNIKNPLFEKNFSSLKDKVKKENLSKTSIENNIIDYLKKLIDQDIKDSDLKVIQGFIWEEGYISGELKGHIYPDVPSKLSEWVSKNIQLGIYSSGSIKAQKLLFKYSEYNDLDKHFSYNFDLQMGSKKDVSSYIKISHELNILPEEITFISDSSDEVNSANKANFKTYLIQRNPDKENKKLGQIESFKDLPF
ncbi:MAG: acireductone synthase [Bdellovibrionales bacterium]|nr:acireductone synthase [Bdellovibrionales bacterium]